ncbi:MAG TPA: HK97 family phage prohead protease [Terracidiphilus sp.]|nr:HK97 family phage prohead protease [Terracidiphilus sp.]
MATIGSIDGYAAVFDSDSCDMGFIEQIDPHAFDSVLATNPDVCCLFNHDDNKLLGRTASGTTRVSADSHGLHYRCSLPDTPTGNEVRELVRRGDISGSSFGFICKRDEWSVDASGNLYRRILEFDQLLDVSPVTYPAYSDTSVS